MKNLGYKIFRRLYKSLTANNIIGKPISATSKILYYERHQHLTFARSKEIKYEPKIREIIKPYIKKGSTVFDVGSNIGQYAMIFHDWIGEEGNLVCVAPDPKNYAFLQFNLNYNIIRNVHAYNLGLGAKEGSMTFFRDSITGGRKGSFIKSYVGDSFEGDSIKMKVGTLQKLVDQHGEPDFIKIDVEGHEANVLKGLDHPLRNTVFMIEAREETKKEVYNFFNSNLFTCLDLDKNAKPIHSAHELNRFTDLLFLPKNA